MKKLLIATKNPGKFAEIKSFLSDLPIQCVSLDDLLIKEDIEETGKTYGENSKKKAIFYARLVNLPTIADDGGIEIDALSGAPGIKSRRFFGKGGREATDEEIIERMKSFVARLPKDKRGGKFRAVLTFALPNGKSFSRTGKVKGVLKEPKLKFLKGYPYRSFFYLPEIKKYYHERDLSDEEMKVYNHRYKAINKLKPVIKKILGF